MENKKDKNDLNRAIYIDRTENEFEYTRFIGVDDDEEDEDKHVTISCFPRKNTVVLIVKELLKINPKIV